MKKFWPHRAKSKGFKVKNFFSKCSSKISNINVPKNEITEEILKEKNKPFYVNDEGEKNSFFNLSINRIHWANRDFSEYKKVS